MSPGTQAVFFFFAFMLFVLAAFIPLRAPESRSPWGIHFGWLGAALIAFVLMIVAFKAS